MTALIAYLLPSIFLLHPFHVSVMEVVHKPEERLVQVSIRIFLDDLELALRAATENNSLDITDTTATEYLEEEIGKYVKSRFTVTTHKNLIFNYLGFEYDQDVLWCYFEASKVKKFDELKISNKLLIEAFDDQENLIHVRKDGKVKSFRLSVSKTFAIARWSEN